MNIRRALDLDNAVLWVPWLIVSIEATVVGGMIYAAWRVLR
jgi:hypothetical protein